MRKLEENVLHTSYTIKFHDFFNDLFGIFRNFITYFKYSNYIFQISSLFTDFYERTNPASCPPATDTPPRPMLTHSLPIHYRFITRWRALPDLCQPGGHSQGHPEQGGIHVHPAGPGERHRFGLPPLRGASVLVGRHPG